jgi:hypothetical protein
MEPPSNDQWPTIDSQRSKCFFCSNTQVYIKLIHIWMEQNICVFYSSWLHRPSEDKIHSTRHHQTPRQGKGSSKVDHGKTGFEGICQDALLKCLRLNDRWIPESVSKFGSCFCHQMSSNIIAFLKYL